MNSTGMNAAVMALIAGTGTWFITAMGAAAVFLYKNPKVKYLNVTLGFAAGVMIAASFWSLLQPAIERAGRGVLPAGVTVCIGFLCGAAFIWLTEKLLGRARRLGKGTASHRAVMLALSITLHNIPEGLAIGVAFGSLGAGGGAVELAEAVSVAVGIGLQNYPEGAAISVPLRSDGSSRLKSFAVGMVSGAVEPVAAFLGAVLVRSTQALLPWALAFAAGAMIAVSVRELIPESQSGEKGTFLPTAGFAAGFSLMMLLDVML